MMADRIASIHLLLQTLFLPGNAVVALKFRYVPEQIAAVYKTVCTPIMQLQTHINYGGYLGPCGNANCNGNNLIQLKRMKFSLRNIWMHLILIQLFEF